MIILQNTGRTIFTLHTDYGVKFSRIIFLTYLSKNNILQDIIFKN